MPRQSHTLTLAGADAVAAAAEREAAARGARVVVAVVDPAGRPLVLRRLDGTQVASVDVAVDKARTAAIFRRPSRELEEQVRAGRIGALALHGAATLTGGVPLHAAGAVVGAIGVSGETPDEDEAVALAGAAALAEAPDGAAGLVAERLVLTQAEAQRVAAAAQEAAEAAGVAPVVAVVDDAGVPVALARPDGSQPASVDVAVDKARTAAIFRRPSRDFEDQTAQGRVAALSLRGATPLMGGLPLVAGGQVVGGVGVSGASSPDQDEDLARAGADALPPPEPFVLDAAAAAAAAGILFGQPGYKVDAGRRDEPGEVEYHERVTDVMLVQEGTATVVVGGEMVGVREVGPGERRAEAVTGGTTHRLSPGAVLVLPAGVPHWFTEVPGPLRYHVVKVVG